MRSKLSQALYALGLTCFITFGFSSEPAEEQGPGTPSALNEKDSLSSGGSAKTKSLPLETQAPLGEVPEPETPLQKPPLSPRPRTPEGPQLEQRKSSFLVEFYEPDLLPTERGKLIRLAISGLAPPKTKVSVKDDTLVILKKDGEIINLDARKASILPLPLETNKIGYFQLAFDVPEGTVQLPIQLVDESGRSKSFQINLLVTRAKVIVAGRKLKQSPKKSYPYSVWGGLGFNYLSYKQSNSTLDSTLNYASFKAPSLFFQGRAKIRPLWDLALTYNLAPGAVVSTDSLLFTNGEYSWTILALEAIREMPFYEDRLFKEYFSKIFLTGGVQHHTVPFMKRIERLATSVTILTIETNDITMLTGGIVIQARRTSSWTHEFLFRAQYPLTSGDTFSIYPKFAFDGSLGAYYTTPKNWQLGIFWYGQWQEYSYATYDPVQDRRISGNQALFFSNLEVRGGFRF